MKIKFAILRTNIRRNGHTYTQIKRETKETQGYINAKSFQIDRSLFQIDRRLNNAMQFFFLINTLGCFLLKPFIKQVKNFYYNIYCDINRQTYIIRAELRKIQKLLPTFN